MRIKQCIPIHNAQSFSPAHESIIITYNAVFFIFIRAQLVSFIHLDKRKQIVYIVYESVENSTDKLVM